MTTLYQLCQQQSIKAQIPVNHKVDPWTRQRDIDGNKGAIISRHQGVRQ